MRKLLRKFRVTGEELVFLAELLPYSYMNELENALFYLESHCIVRPQQIDYSWLNEFLSYELHPGPFIFRLQDLEVIGSVDQLLRMYFVAPGSSIEKLQE